MTRWCTSLLLILSLLASGLSGAITQAAAPAVDQVVICDGHGTSQIYLDAEGNPTVAPQHCPDCAPASVAVLSPPASATWHDGTVTRLDVPLQTLALVHAPASEPAARGPPLPV